MFGCMEEYLLKSERHGFEFGVRVNLLECSDGVGRNVESVGDNGNSEVQ